MKIAFVNQAFDVIVPPFQNSIGYCTYGICRSLAKSSEVSVYGLRDVHPDDASHICDPSLDLRLIPAAHRDHLYFKTRVKLGTLIQMSSPISTSRLLFPDYGRLVAQDIRRHNYDIVHVQHCSQYVPIIKALNPRAKIVLQLHAEWFSQSDFEILQQRLVDVDLLLTVSDHITQKTKRDFPEVADRCETLHGAIELSEFRHPKNYDPGRIRKEKRILFSGAVSPHKGIHSLLDAFHMVVKEYPDVHLEIIGSQRNYPMEETFDLHDQDVIRSVSPFYRKHPIMRVRSKLGLGTTDGTYQQYLEDKLTADIKDKVSFAGFVPRQNLVDQYYDADIFVFPPIWEEGFGIPPIEAMAAGTPVIGTRSGGIVETVKDGETGFLVEKNDPRALAQQILRLLKEDDLREQMGRAARHRVFSNFTWDRIAGCLESKYLNLIQEPSKEAYRELHAGAAR
jgi:glycosyltransferase involved in cell wall biosynthesis